MAVKDYANTFDTDNLTLSANGSEKIGGSTDDKVLRTEGVAATLVFIDSTPSSLSPTNLCPKASDLYKAILLTGIPVALDNLL